jgi:hypothetical protein
MQYLECLSAALQDMVYTYQPAERMFVVIQAVLAEFRGIPITDPHYLLRHSFTKPMRRDSTTMDTTEMPSMTKRRHIRRANSRNSMSLDAAARPSTNTNTTNGSGSSSSGAQDLHIDPLLASMTRRKPSDSDLDRPDGFVMVTPRSELGSWSVSLADHPTAANNNGSTTTTTTTGAGVGANSSSSTTTNGLPPHLTDSTSSSSAAAASGQTTSQQGGATWMGAESHDISHLASVHFPELRDLPSLNDNGEPGPVPNLDFLSFGNPGDEWREWATGGPAGQGGQDGGPGGDLDGYAGAASAYASNGFAGTPGRFEGRLTGIAEGI